MKRSKKITTLILTFFLVIALIVIGRYAVGLYFNKKFRSLGIVGDSVVFTCGSSVTASVLGVAYSLINNKYMPTIYIGSWSEYGKI